MRIFNRFFGIIFAALFLYSCNSYQLASYYDDYDGIYSSNSNSSAYQKIFDDIAYDIPEKDLVNSNLNLPWGDNPESTDIVFNLFPNYSFNPFYNNYYFGSSNYYRLNPYYSNYYMYGFNNSYYSPFGYYFNPYNSFENPYWYNFRFSRYYPYYNYRFYDNYKDDYYYGAKSNVSYARVNSRRGEKQNPRSESRKSDISKISNIYSRGSSLIGRSTNFDDIENDRIINNPRNNEVRSYQSDRIYSRDRGQGRGESIRISNYVPNLNTIKREQIKNTYREARTFRNSIDRIDYNNSTNNYKPNVSQSNNRSYNNNSRAGESFSRSNSVGGSRSSGVSRGSSSGRSGGSGGSSSRGSGKIN